MTLLQTLVKLPLLCSTKTRARSWRGRACPARWVHVKPLYLAISAISSSRLLPLWALHSKNGAWCCCRNKHPAGGQLNLSCRDLTGCSAGSSALLVCLIWILKAGETSASLCPCSVVTALWLSAWSSLLASSISTTPSPALSWREEPSLVSDNARLLVNQPQRICMAWLTLTESIQPLTAVKEETSVRSYMARMPSALR